MNICLIVHNRQWRDCSAPFICVRDGLRRAGHEVSFAAPLAGRLWQRQPDAVFLWNGIHGACGRIVRQCKSGGITVFVMERGFFDRFNYVQIDHAGFNHTASWAGLLGHDAPESGEERFHAAWGEAPRMVRSRRRGYILVFLQMPEDAQLADSEIRHPGQVVHAVEDAVRRDVEIRVRAHPRHAWNNRAGRSKMIAGTLTDAIAGARFAVTINSNAGNEALAWGCRVLCFGPALYGTAGVALQTTLTGLRRAIETMLAGWRPDNQHVRNYLYHLACRQWTCSEIADSDGRILQNLLAAAGLT